MDTRMLMKVKFGMVLSRLDYGNATLAGLPGNQLDRLQSVMNAAARLVCSARKYDARRSQFDLGRVDAYI